MIKLNEIPQEIVLTHKKYFESDFLPKLEELKNKNRLNAEYKKFVDFLYNKYEKIITAKPEELYQIKLEIESNHNFIYHCLKTPTTKTHKNYKSQLNEIFNYESFCRVKVTKWDAYKFTDKLNVIICPYCNRSFTTTHNDDLGQTRPTLDHFYDKARYPYFALSIYNLIPSCYVCNSSFKGSKEVDIDTHLHPYIEGFEGHARYILKPENGKFQNIFNGKYKVELEVFQSSTYGNQIKNNEELFHLSDLYNYHHDYINQLINQKMMYSKPSIKQLSKLKIFKNEEEVMLLLLGEKGGLNVNSKNKLLSKLLKDISNQLSLGK